MSGEREPFTAESDGRDVRVVVHDVDTGLSDVPFSVMLTAGQARLFAARLLLAAGVERRGPRGRRRLAVVP